MGSGAGGVFGGWAEELAWEGDGGEGRHVGGGVAMEKRCSSGG